MATSYTSVTVDNVTSISTTEKFISDEVNPGGHIAVAPNEVLVLSVSVGAHANDDIIVTAYGSIDGTDTNRYELTSFTIPAGDTDEHEIGSFVGVPNVDVGYVASGPTDTPTATTQAKRGPLNGS